METQLQLLKNKIISPDKLSSLLAVLRFRNKKIVFTNGCFDIVHRGHIEYLSKAADLGDVLFLGLNTDNSIRRIKGDSRPINDEQSRATVLAALCFVDYIVLFDDDTPYELIKTIQPDVLVKGKDYEAKAIVGYDIVTQKGGTIETIDLVEGFSTTSIIEKIKQ